MDEQRRTLERAAVVGGHEDQLASLRVHARTDGFYPPAIRLPDYVWLDYQRTLPERTFLTNYPPGDPHALLDAIEGRIRIEPQRGAEFITVEFTLEPIEETDSE